MAIDGVISQRVTVRPLGRWLVALALALALGGAAWLGYQRYAERYVVTVEPDSGEAVSRVVAARLAGAGSLKVAELSGTVQSAASDVRGFGLLRSDQVVKAPFSVDYFVDVSRIDDGALQWVAASRTLIVDAPDVIPAPANVDEGARTLVRTSGVFVSRSAGEALSQRTSRTAQAKAAAEARSPERMAQAREHGRQALARLLGAPLAALGYDDARVIVTFPAERGGRPSGQMDRSTSLEQVYGRPTVETR